MNMMNRREFLRSTLAAGAAAALPSSLFAEATTKPALIPKADAMVLIYLPGGICQRDMWDCKKHTPFTKDMKGSELLGTCPIIPTSADGIQLGSGLENLATQMHHACILRTLTNEVKFGALHLKAQYYLMTGYLFPAGFKAPSIGAVVARSLGRKNPQVPPYIYIGRDIDTSDNEKLFASEYLGPGFYGVNYAPFMIPDPATGLSTLYAAAGVGPQRLDRRQQLLGNLVKAGPRELKDSQKAADYMKVMA